jgi:hypothetical protein
MVSARSSSMDGVFSCALHCIHEPLGLVSFSIVDGIGCLPLVQSCHFQALLGDCYTKVYALFQSKSNLTYFTNYSFSMKYPFD